MELKDLIQQTLDEFSTDSDSIPKTSEDNFPKKKPAQTQNFFQQEENIQQPSLNIDSRFLEILREKTLVLFEGLQNSQTKDLSAKLDLVINYLEYQLSLIDEALQKS